MAELSITGKLIAAMPTQSGTSQRTGKAWVKREYVLEIPGQYVRHFSFTVFGEERLKEFNLRKDEEVTVFFDIDANEYNGKWYNQVTAYKVQRVGQQQAAQPAPAPEPSPSAQAAVIQQPVQQAIFDNSAQEGQGSADNLPF